MKYLYLGIAALVILTAFGFVVRWYGDSRYDAGVSSCQAAQKTAIVEKVQKNETKRIEIRQLPDDSLVRRYCKWVYGGTYDECVRTVKPLD